ncbi:MAG: hypothetical protein ACRDNZ_15475 [Streptosporangiaceae bacterium]
MLLAVDGYRYGGQDFDRRATVDRIEASLATLRATVRLGYLHGEGDWPAVFPATRDPLEFERLPFAHPAVDRLLQRDHRPAQADSARARRPAPGAPEGLAAAS